MTAQPDLTGTNELDLSAIPMIAVPCRFCDGNEKLFYQGTSAVLDALAFYLCDKCTTPARLDLQRRRILEARQQNGTGAIGRYRNRKR